MILVSKLITAFLTPPGCFILLLTLIVIFMRRKYRIRLALLAFFLYLFSIEPVSDFLLKPLENYYPPLSSPLSTLRALDVDRNWPNAIVVLGGGTVMGSPEAGEGKDTLSADALKRAVYAFSLRNMFNAPFVFSGGKVFEFNQQTEAAVAESLFLSFGLPPGLFKREEQSRNTWENARETAKLGIERAILVTSAYHMKRSVYCFERNGIFVIPAPTDYKTDRGRKYNILSFLPSMRSLENTAIALHEHIGLLYYRIFYR